MSDMKLESQFDEIKESVPVNQELKQNLRQYFIKKRRKSKIIRAAALVAACAVVTASLVSYNSLFIQKVDAASLKISNQISVADIASGNMNSISEHKGTLYIPVSGEGLFLYDNNGYRKVLDQEVSSAKIAPDGQRIVLSSGKSLSILDLASKNRQVILDSEDSDIIFEDLSWSKDQKKIIFVKKNVKVTDNKETGEIEEIDLGSLKSRNLTTGAHPSYVPDKSAIIFERDGQVLYKSLKNGVEKVVDLGKDPSVSPDGKFIAYVKPEIDTEKVLEEANVLESLENVWITDSGDFLSKKQVTYNFVKSSKNGNPASSLDMKAKLTRGAYSYYEPIWGSDLQNLYVLKASNTNGTSAYKRLMKIDLSNEKMTSTDTTKKFLQALISRDDDYAKSIMKAPPAYLTGSNPHYVGYRILSEGQENGKEYVEAEEYLSYTANPFYQIVKNRFYLEPSENGYIIDSVETINDYKFNGFDQNGIVNLERDGTAKKQVLNEKDIPSELIKEQKHRFSSLAYKEQSNMLYFTIQYMKDGEKTSSIQLMSYNLGSGKYEVIDNLEPSSKDEGITVTNVIVDDKCQYIAMVLTSYENQKLKSNTIIYDLKDNKKINSMDLFKDNMMDSINVSYWNDGNLIFNALSGKQTVKYIYNPEKSELSNMEK